MTEDEAIDWTARHFETAVVGRLEHLAAIVTVENDQQNLIARSTIGSIWARHIVDSLQLLSHAPKHGLWLDIGTGAGFPGLAVACVDVERRFLLVEPRRLRADFLRSAAATIGLENVDIVTGKVESVDTPASIISARAVARIDAVFGAAVQCAKKDTLWLLPKGRSAREEVAHAFQRWHGKFHVEHSLTDPESSIVVASGVRRR